MSSARLLLALDASTDRLGAAVLRGHEVLSEQGLEAAGGHAEGVLPAVEEVLAAAAVGPAELEAFAVTVGPGSFTGLRVAVATIKGLALPRGEPVAAVSTLRALEATARETLPPELALRPVAAVLDARRGELYAGVFGPAGEELLPEDLYRPGELAARLPPGTLVAGVGAETVAALPGGALVVPRPVAAPSAGVVGRLGQALLDAGRGVAARSLVPRYLRRAEAEVRRTGRASE